MRRLLSLDFMTETILTKGIVLDALRQVIDPEIGCNIVDLGLIYSIAIDGGAVRITMTLTTPGCPMSQSIAAGARAALYALDAVTDADVDIVFDPPWHPSMMTEEGQNAVNFR